MIQLAPHLERETTPPGYPPVQIPLENLRASIGILTDSEIHAMENDDLVTMLFDAQMSFTQNLQTASADRQTLLQLALRARNYCQQ